MSTARDLQDRLAREVAPERPSRARTAARAPSPVPQPPETAKALQARLDAEYEGEDLPALPSLPFALEFGWKQENFYEAVRRRRDQFGLTLVDLDERCEFNGRRMSKIEPLRNRSKGPNHRPPFKFECTPAATRIMNELDLVLVIMDADTADELIERAAAPPPKLRTHERRKAGIPGEQLALPLPSPVRRSVSVAQVEEAARDRAVRKRLEEAA